MARAAIRGPRLGLSPISLWEIALKLEKGQISLDSEMDAWIDRVLSRANVHVLPITERIAVRAAQLRMSVGRDPADTLIVATALHHGVPLVTRDERIRRAGAVETIW